MDQAQSQTPARPSPGSVLEVFLAFLGLGLTSFGGPIAHLGYFRRAFVERRSWLSEAAYAETVALCQFLPGPASSQAGYAIGLMRAGFWGGLAAWVGFSLPSALLMLAFAYAQPYVGQGPIGEAAIHGLKLTAVAIVAQAVLGMARTLCPDRTRASIAVAAALIVLFAPPAVCQIGAIALGAILGALACAPKAPEAPLIADRAGPGPRPASLAGLAVFALLFLPGGALLGGEPMARLFHAFYRSGALVFGGGHVVLPLLRDQVVTPGWVPENVFLAGYGAAQALPGPLFSLAAYLGAVSKVGGGIAGAAAAVVALSLAGLILVWALLPHWRWIRQFRAAQAVTAGVNAAVVGILGVAFYNPVWLSAVATSADLAIVLVAFILLTAWKAPPLAVVGLCLAAAVAPVLVA